MTAPAPQCQRRAEPARQDTPTLLPCPFCGADAEMSRFTSRVSPSKNVETTQIQCGNDDYCHVTVDIQHVNEAVAVEAWNTRSDARLTSEIEALKARNGELEGALKVAFDYIGAFSYDYHSASTIRLLRAALQQPKPGEGKT